MSEFMEYVEKVKPICEGMQKTFGNRIEFILHDLSKPESSVVFVAGDLTKRQLGAPATNILMRTLSKYGDDAKDIISYPSISRDGKVLKSSTIFVRNESGKIIGCFCMNIDITEFNAVMALIEDIPHKGTSKSIFCGVWRCFPDKTDFPALSKIPKLWCHTSTPNVTHFNLWYLNKM